MTTSTQTKVAKPAITKEELRQGLKQLLPFSVTKIGETIFDTLVTLLFAGIAIAVPATLQAQRIPVTYGECMVYIVSIFVLIIIRRVVQDFDESFTVDELADEVNTLKHIASETYRIVKNDSSISDEELDDRLNSIP